jgi:hypothetical protein
MPIWRSFLLALAFVRPGAKYPKIWDLSLFQPFSCGEGPIPHLPYSFAIWMDYIVHTPNRGEPPDGSQILPSGRHSEMDADTRGSARNRMLPRVRRL